MSDDLLTCKRCEKLRHIKFFHRRGKFRGLCYLCSGKGITAVELRGRPEGHRLSQKTKNKITASKTGYRHTIEARDNIAKGVTGYYRKKNPVSKNLKKWYRDDAEASAWLRKNSWYIDEDDDIISAERLRSINSNYEVAIGDMIECMPDDSLNPEELLLLKEKIENEYLDEEGEVI